MSNVCCEHMVLHTLPLLEFPAGFPKSLILTAICPLEQMTEKEKAKIHVHATSKFRLQYTYKA